MDFYNMFQEQEKVKVKNNYRIECLRNKIGKIIRVTPYDLELTYLVSFDKDYGYLNTIDNIYKNARWFNINHLETLIQKEKFKYFNLRDR